MSTIAFIGLGNMGGPMAANLIKAGHEVTGFDMAPAALEAFANNGGRIANSGAVAVREADVVITMLPAGPHVREVYTSEGGLLAAATSDSAAEPTVTLYFPLMSSTLSPVIVICCPAPTEITWDPLT